MDTFLGAMRDKTIRKELEQMNARTSRINYRKCCHRSKNSSGENKTGFNLKY
jgi:hypothetical protein